jgi:hypothetical protein
VKVLVFHGLQYGGVEILRAFGRCKSGRSCVEVPYRHLSNDNFKSEISQKCTSKVKVFVVGFDFLGQ